MSIVQKRNVGFPRRDYVLGQKTSVCCLSARGSSSWKGAKVNDNGEASYGYRKTCVDIYQDCSIEIPDANMLARMVN
jgi:hypothetical protein